MSDEQGHGGTQRALLAGRYRVEEELGRGGMAKVFKGTDTVLGRPVAIKILAPQFAEDASFVARFRREAQAAARLNAPHVVSVYDTGSDDGIHFIVMEYVEAKTLADYLAGGGRILPDRAIELAASVCEALSAAHAAGIVHRDIKPANVMVARDGNVKVTDFGIARLTTSADTVAQTAAVLGTASYLSPEQAQGLQVDPRSDIYSLGIVLYEMVTGHPPFAGDSPVVVASKHVLEQPTPPSKANPDVSPELEAVIMKALAKNPVNRYQTADEFRSDLERARLGRPVDATPLLPESAQTQVIARPEHTAVLPPAQPSGGGRRWWVGVLVAILILGVLGGGLYLLAAALLKNDETPQVKVPDVRGFTEDAATRTLTTAGFRVKPEPKVTSNPADVGHVLDQQPPPETLLKKGETVTITIGKAPRQVPVPNVIGKTQADAEKLINDANLKVSVTPQADPATVGTVIDQNPLPDTPVSVGSTVTIVVSTGPQAITVPDLTCFSFGQAKAKLDQLGLNIQLAGTMPQNALCPNGNKIVLQDPAAFAQANLGDTVQVWVAEESPSPSPSPSESPSPTPSPT